MPLNNSVCPVWFGRMMPLNDSVCLLMDNGSALRRCCMKNKTTLPLCPFTSLSNPAKPPSSPLSTLLPMKKLNKKSIVHPSLAGIATHLRSPCSFTSNYLHPHYLFYCFHDLPSIFTTTTSARLLHLLHPNQRQKHRGITLVDSLKAHETKVQILN
ncbi:hypothetical protein HanXRQr2_Chr14g0667241 [Helianthus annuus]|uniref:Uncharacterized protein n=1 Tax=Helianthus annuus TaxID=4232 RepID=A0A9K3EEN7_HELAN|nr:hypothetical protein HanXRQr2_Chr14g0667241 [Helianthus annuus]KAJ0842319.1 hypothetical protein HanPSC8_Chr14g0640301 [Helianthus annuus]